MKVRPTKLRAALLAVAIVGMFAFLAARRVTSVAAIQDSLERDWEINFNAGERPRLLPSRVDAAAQSLIQRILGPEPEHLFLGQKPNRDTVWCERFRALFRGRITEMEIYYPGRLRHDLGSALARFSALRRLTIHEAGFSDSDWAYVFAGLQRLPHLEELEIGSYEFRDSTIEPLANQRSLRRISITLGRFSTECVETFRQMPKLTELDLSSNTIDDGHEPSEPPLPSRATHDHAVPGE